MLSDISELTDLSSDEDEGQLGRKTRSAGKNREYQVKPSLRPPRTSQYTAKALYDHIVENTIDLDPEYQRDIVWPESKQTGLIDSLIHNYYIPPIVFAVKVSKDGYEKRTCIDGKQRLTSIQRFMDGLIPHKDSFTNQKLWFSTNGVSNRKLLPQQYRKLFANKQIVCVEYETLEPDQEREIFQRVQLGVALTPAERMQAISGPWPTLIRDVLNQVLGEDGFDGYLEWGRGRGRDFQCMTSIAYIMEKFPRHTNPSVVQLEKWLQDIRPVPAKFRDSLFDTFRIFVLLARDQTLRACFQSPTRVSPVEFVMIGLLINVYCTQLSPTQISSAIEKLRSNVRANFRDIRMNATITRHMFNFVTKKIKVSELKSDQKGDIPATAKRQAVPSPPRPTKRKRVVVDSDDDESERPARPTKTKITAANPTKSVKASSSLSSNLKVGVPAVKPSKPPKPTYSMTHIPRTSILSSSRPNPGPASGLSTPSIPNVSLPTPPTVPAQLLPAQPRSPPLPSIPAPVTPPTPAPTEMSLPPVQTLTTGSPPMVHVKHESRASSPVPVVDQPTVTQEAFSNPVSSSVPDRLAPIRAAKAALMFDNCNATLSPSLNHSKPASTLRGETVQPSFHTSRQPAAQESSAILPGLQLTKGNLDTLLLKVGFQPQLFLPAVPPSPLLQKVESRQPLANNPSLSDMPRTPQPSHQTAQSSVQPEVQAGNPATFPAKLPPTEPASDLRMPSGGPASSDPRPASQGLPPSCLLAAQIGDSGLANATTTHPPFQRPAASAPEHQHDVQPPASSCPPYLPSGNLAPMYHGRGGYAGPRGWSRDYDARGRRDGPAAFRGGYGARGRYRDETGYRNGSWRDWERREQPWRGRGRSPPSRRYKREQVE